MLEVQPVVGQKTHNCSISGKWNNVFNKICWSVENDFVICMLASFLLFICTHCCKQCLLSKIIWFMVGLQNWAHYTISSKISRLSLLIISFSDLKRSFQLCRWLFSRCNWPISRLRKNSLLMLYLFNRLLSTNVWKGCLKVKQSLKGPIRLFKFDFRPHFG